MDFSSNKNFILYVSLYSVALFFLMWFWPIGWFGDDSKLLRFGMDHSPSECKNVFMFKFQEMSRYRPMIQLISSLNYKYFGLQTSFIIILQWLLIIYILIGVYAIVKSKGLPNTVALFSTIFVSINPFHNQAFFRPGRPELYVTVILISILLLLTNKKLIRFIGFRTLICCILTSISIGFSEASIAFFGLIFLYNFLSSHKNRFILMLPILFCLFFVFWFNHLKIFNILVDGQNSRYQINFGLNFISNYIQYLVGIFVPFSSPIFYKIYIGQSNFFEIITCLLWLVFITLFYIQIFKNLRKIEVFSTLSILIIGLPFIILGHISEVYLLPGIVFTAIWLAEILSESNIFSKKYIVLSISLLGFVLICWSINNYLILYKNSTKFRNIYTSIKNISSENQAKTIQLISKKSKMNFSQYYDQSYSFFDFNKIDSTKIIWVEESFKNSENPTFEILESGALKQIK